MFQYSFRINLIPYYNTDETSDNIVTTQGLEKYNNLENLYFITNFLHCRVRFYLPFNPSKLKYRLVLLRKD